MRFDNIILNIYKEREGMQYKKIMNYLDKTNNQPSKLKTKNYVEVNDESRRRYNTGGKMKFKTTMLNAFDQF